jgi:hypothetical protein
MKAEQTVWVSFGRAAHLSSAIVRASSCLPASVESKQRLTRAVFLSFLLLLASPPKPTPPVLSGNNGALLLRWCISLLRLLLAEVGLFPDRPDTGAGLVFPAYIRRCLCCSATDADSEGVVGCRRSNGFCRCGDEDTTVARDVVVREMGCGVVRGRARELW